MSNENEPQKRRQLDAHYMQHNLLLFVFCAAKTRCKFLAKSKNIFINCDDDASHGVLLNLYVLI